MKINEHFEKVNIRILIVSFENAFFFRHVQRDMVLLK